MLTDHDIRLIKISNFSVKIHQLRGGRIYCFSVKTKTFRRLAISSPGIDNSLPSFPIHLTPIRPSLSLRLFPGRGRGGLALLSFLLMMVWFWGYI